MIKKISIQYFAILREEAGLSTETIESDAVDLAGLFRERSMCHNFSLSIDRLKVALNDEFCDWSRSFEENDRVVFIPPVAGG